MEQFFNYKEFLNGFIKSFLTQAPKIILIAVLSFAAVHFSRIFTSRMEKAIKEDDELILVERRQRARTVGGIMHNSIKIVVAVAAGMMILQELGIKIAPILASVGFIGLAFGFGAQSLVKDIVTGFFLIVEGQYSVGDVIKIGDVGGLVEGINLRVTTLRDIQGVVHYIPNGQINMVSNLTKGWSRALVHVGVAYKENVDRVMETIRQVCDDIKADEKFGSLLLEDFEIPGVESLDDSAVTIRVMVKTAPLKQWDVMREMRRRFKNRFDEEGIEIPFPQRAVWLRKEE
jgi:small conductance mechanosensitive channel